MPEITQQSNNDIIFNDGDIKECLNDIVYHLREREEQKTKKKLHEVMKVDYDLQLKYCIEKLDILRKKVESKQNLSDYTLLSNQEEDT